jgi:predicted HAD superfamily Cof-like phosphohydrolase
MDDNISPYFYVLEFHEKFGLDINSDDSTDLRELRYDLLSEEMHETYKSLIWDEEPLEDVAKELADLVYVAYGTAIALGINLDEALRRVHESNLTKLVDGEAVRREDGKVLKGENYVAPDMEGVVY